MNDPQRLLWGEADERERALLRAAADEEPSADALARLQQTLGLTVEPAPLSVPRTGAPVLEAAASPARSASLSALRWLLLGCSSAALVFALAWTRLSPAPESDRPAASEHTREPGARAPDAVGSSAPAAAEPEGALASAGDAPVLRDEIARLERARTALRAQLPRVALTTLDDYDLAHPRGTLREEAQALRIESLFALGEVARASELTRGFLRSYPHSVHGARVSSQLEPRGAR